MKTTLQIVLLGLVVGLFCPLASSAANADAGKLKWMEENLEDLVKNLDTRGYLADHSTAVGREVIGAISNSGHEKWPFRRDLSNTNNCKAIAGTFDDSWGSNIRGTSRNETQYMVNIPSNAAVLVTVVWFYGRDNNTLRFHDVRIDTIGQKAVGVLLSEIIKDKPVARAKLGKVVPSDMEVVAGILALLEGRTGAPTIQKMCEIADTPERVDAVKKVQFAINQAREFRRKATSEEKSMAEEKLRKINIAAQGKLDGQSNVTTDQGSVVHADAKLEGVVKAVYENAKMSKKDCKEEMFADLPFLDEANLESLKVALDKLRPIGVLPPELDWFFDVAQLYGR